MVILDGCPFLCGLWAFGKNLHINSASQLSIGTTDCSSVQLVQLMRGVHMA
jgi:hypothetical protein